MLMRSSSVSATRTTRTAPGNMFTQAASVSLVPRRASTGTTSLLVNDCDAAAAAASSSVWGITNTHATRLTTKEHAPRRGIFRRHSTGSIANHYSYIHDDDDTKKRNDPYWQVYQLDTPTEAFHRSLLHGTWNKNHTNVWAFGQQGPPSFVWIEPSKSVILRTERPTTCSSSNSNNNEAHKVPLRNSSEERFQDESSLRHQCLALPNRPPRRAESPLQNDLAGVSPPPFLPPPPRFASTEAATSNINKRVPQEVFHFRSSTVSQQSAITFSSSAFDDSFVDWEVESYSEDYLSSSCCNNAKTHPCPLGLCSGINNESNSGRRHGRSSWASETTVSSDFRNSFATKGSQMSDTKLSSVVPKSLRQSLASETTISYDGPEYFSDDDDDDDESDIQENGSSLVVVSDCSSSPQLATASKASSLPMISKKDTAPRMPRSHYHQDNPTRVNGPLRLPVLRESQSQMTDSWSNGVVSDDGQGGRSSKATRSAADSATSTISSSDCRLEASMTSNLVSAMNMRFI